MSNSSSQPINLSSLTAKFSNLKWWQATIMIVSILLAGALFVHEGGQLNLSFSIQTQVTAIENRLDIPVNSTLSAFQKSNTYLVIPHDTGACLMNSDGYLKEYSLNHTQVIDDGLTNASINGGSVYVEAGPYSAPGVVIPNDTRLVLELGATGITYSVAPSATCIIDDFNSGIFAYYQNGAIFSAFNYAAGTLLVSMANLTTVYTEGINPISGTLRITGLTIQNGTSFPSSPVSGYIFDLNNTVYYYNSTSWVPWGTSSGTGGGPYLLQNGTTPLTGNWNVGSSDGIYGVTYLNATNLYCASINQLVSGQGVSILNLIVQSGTSFPSPGINDEVFYRSDQGILYVDNSGSWTPTGSSSGNGSMPQTYPYANLTGVPVLLFANGSQVLTANWNAGGGTYGIYGLSFLNATSINANTYYLNNQIIGFTEPPTIIISQIGANYEAWYGFNSTLAWASTNATTVINNALAMGGTVDLAAGFYNLTSQLIITNSVTFTGQDNASVISMPLSIQLPILMINNTNSVNVNHLTFTHNSVIGNNYVPNSFGIQVVNCSEVNIAFCHIYQCGSGCITFGYSNMDVAILGITVTNSSIKDNEIGPTSSDGFDNCGGTNILIENNFFHNLPDDCIQINGQDQFPATDFTVTGNIIANGYTGVFLMAGMDTTSGPVTQNIMIADNVFTNLSSNAIQANACTGTWATTIEVPGLTWLNNVTVTSNIFSNIQDGLSTDVDLLYVYIQGLTMTDNVFSNSSGTDLIASYIKDSQISGNTICSAPVGMTYISLQDVEVNNNIFTNVTYGIYSNVLGVYGFSQQDSFSDNHFVLFGSGAMFLNWLQGPQIDGNVIASSSGYGIDIVNASEAEITDNILNPQSPAIWTVVCNDSLITENNLVCGAKQIWIQNSTRTELANNKISMTNYGGYAVYIDASNYTISECNTFNGYGFENSTCNGYAFEELNGADNNTYLDNDVSQMRPPMISQFFNLGVHDVVEGNIGYNPLGSIANPVGPAYLDMTGAWFGNQTTVGTTTTTESAGRVDGANFTATTTGSIMGLSFYECNTTTNVVSEAMIYYYSNDSLLGTTGQITVSSPNAEFFNYTFAAPISVTAGTVYILARFANGTMNDYYPQGNNYPSAMLQNVSTYPTVPNPFVISSTTQNRSDTCFAIYSSFYLNNSGTAPISNATIYINTQTPKTICFDGGTIVSITVNGRIIYTATEVSITLNVGDKFEVIYSTAPTVTVLGQ